ncbi:MAG TPA: hypothetical protein VKZ53_23835 [Candidatus Angelobacter sp.]|nr:hypothetical protein [Candidatus Angelobacter sp.]
MLTYCRLPVFLLLSCFVYLAQAQPNAVQAAAASGKSNSVTVDNTETTPEAINASTIPKQPEALQNSLGTNSASVIAGFNVQKFLDSTNIVTQQNLQQNDPKNSSIPEIDPCPYQIPDIPNRIPENNSPLGSKPNPCPSRPSPCKAKRKALGEAPQAGSPNIQVGPPGINDRIPGTDPSCSDQPQKPCTGSHCIKLGDPFEIPPQTP